VSNTISEFVQRFERLPQPWLMIWWEKGMRNANSVDGFKPFLMKKGSRILQTFRNDFIDLFLDEQMSLENY
jgi:hypothetical protein